VRVDFYVIEDEHEEALVRVASRLLAKAYAGGLRAWVLCADEHAASTLDTYLWTYKDNSFLPHSIAGEAPEGLNPPIQISTNSMPEDNSFNLLLNLRETTPENYEVFERVLDVVAHNAKDAGRARYRAYREQGLELHKHAISSPSK
jgi:DNA polymerase III subunit chi